MRRLVLLAAVVALTGCGSSTTDRPDRPGADDPVRCTGTLAARDVAGPLVVPQGKTCRLDGTLVRGRVTVRRDATLVARSSVLAGGLRARGFAAVELAAGGPEEWPTELAERAAVYVLEDGGRVTLTAANHNGDYRVLRNTGPIEVRGLSFDTGSLTCRGNRQQPVVRRISAETPGVLKGQCSGLRRGVPVPGVWGQTDF